MMTETLVVTSHSYMYVMMTAVSAVLGVWNSIACNKLQYLELIGEAWAFRNSEYY